jgi:hypothetical protein
VRQGYLKNMYFGIAQDAAATHLLEVCAAQEAARPSLCTLLCKLTIALWPVVFCTACKQLCRLRRHNR